MLAFLYALLADQFQHPSPLQLYLTGAVYSLDGSDSLQETMQRNVNFSLEVKESWLLSEQEHGILSRITAHFTAGSQSGHVLGVLPYC